MGRGLIKIKDLFFDWSTIVDAPVTFGMKEEGLRAYIKAEAGECGLDKLQQRIDRCNQKGTSFIEDEDLKSTICFNRAGPNETCITAEEIYERFSDEEAYERFGESATTPTGCDDG